MNRNSGIKPGKTLHRVMLGPAVSMPRKTYILLNLRSWQKLRYCWQDVYY